MKWPGMTAAATAVVAAAIWRWLFGCWMNVATPAIKHKNGLKLNHMYELL